VRWFEGLVLPVLTLGLAGTGADRQADPGRCARRARQGVRHRAAGSWAASERAIVFKHVLRNAATPVLSVAGLVVVGLFGRRGAAETVFVMPGLGGLAVTATATHDLPVIQGSRSCSRCWSSRSPPGRDRLRALNPKVRT